MSDVPAQPKPIGFENWGEGEDSEETGTIGLEDVKMLKNPYLDYKMLKKIGKLGTQADLKILRELNEEYYGTLNPTYLNIVAGRIIFSVACTRERGKRHRKYYFTLKTKIGELDWSEWNPQVAQFHRKLWFDEVWIQKLRNDQPQLYKVATDLFPYITSLRLNNFPIDTEDPANKYAEFLNEFTSLKNLEIDYTIRRISEHFTVDGMSPDQLEIGLGGLKLKPKIKFYASNGLEGILEKFATKENTSFQLDFCIPWRCNLQDFENISNQFGNQTNIKYTIRFSVHPFHVLDQMKVFTEICIKLNDQIEKLALFLAVNFEKFEIKLEEEDALSIKKYLGYLSPFINKLKIRQGKTEQALAILPHDSEYPKLVELAVEKYRHSLEILKKCPSLRKLKLIAINETSCIFSNTQQSNKESLLEYFGNLSQLKYLTLDDKVGNRIINGNDLDGHLKVILPNLQTIKYK